MNKNKGFTLIELLVVIAIIGILSSVVLASLNQARNKGNDAAIKNNLANIRPQAEMVYDGVSPNSYDTICENTTIGAMRTSAQSANGGTATACFDSSSAWSISSPLKAGNHWCVDSTGASKQVSSATTTTVCPAS